MKEAHASTRHGPPLGRDGDLFHRSSGQLSATEGMIASTDLLRGRPSVLIEHRGAVYQLRATSQGKLILTK